MILNLRTGCMVIVCTQRIYLKTKFLREGEGMNKEEFDKLPKEAQDIVFDEMCELLTLTYNYPMTFETLKIFTEWDSSRGLYGNDLKEFLDKKLESNQTIYNTFRISSELLNQDKTPSAAIAQVQLDIFQKRLLNNILTTIK